MVHVPKSVMVAVDAILAKDTEEVGLLSKWNQVAEVLTDNYFAWHELVHPNQMLCHPSNRGKLGLNAAGAHRVLLRIKTVGGDKKRISTRSVLAIVCRSEQARRAIAF